MGSAQQDKKYPKNDWRQIKRWAFEPDGTLIIWNIQGDPTEIDLTSLDDIIQTRNVLSV